jgi:SNF2 family DNA or RNA helicase
MGMAMTYQPARPLWKQQEAALPLLAKHRVFALLMEMRTGKTAPILVDFFRSDSDDLLVIAPAGCYRTWVTAIKDIGAPGDIMTYLWSADDAPSEAALFLRSFGRKILIINVEALSSVKRARKLVLQFAGRRTCMIVIDESTCIKNDDALRTKFIVDELGPLAYRKRILSGLPTPRSPLDIYSQFAFLDRRIIGAPTYESFFNRHAITRHVANQVQQRYVKVVAGYKDVEAINKRIAPFCYRVLRSDCYEVPEKLYVRRDVELTKEQKRIYRELKEYATSQLESEGHVTVQMVITQMLRLHQVLMGHIPDDDTGIIREVPSHRIRELVQVLREVSGKAIVWCSYDHSIQAITMAVAKEFGLGSVARFWGGNRKTREEEEKSFKENERCFVMVGTPSAGRFGRDWAVANTVIYYSSTPDLDHRLQSEDRPQKIGKLDSVTYIDLIAPGTIEEKFLKVLREKKRLADVVTGDKWKDWL